MPRRVTVTFADGSSHVYENTPDDVTPQQIVDRATREFSKPVKKLDGGRGMLERGARAVADTVSGAVGAIDNAMQPLREAVGYDPEEQNRKTDELARQIRERQRADLAKQDGILDTAGDLFTRGMAGASAGIERVASGLALNDAERQRFVSRARENEAIAKTGIAGETTWDAATGNLAKMPGFILEKGIESLPYMATAAVGPFGALANAGSTTGRIAQSRAEADGRQDASGKDVAIAAPFGTVSTLIDSLSLGAMSNGIGGGLARGIMRDAATEGLTEAVQSGIEYTGGSVGTKQGFDLGEMGSQMLQGGLVGAGVGGGFGVVTEGTKATFDAAGRIKSRRADDTRTPGPGIREQAIADATILTPEDMASPLDNADIAAGRVEIAGATAGKAADNALTQAGLPKVGSKVNVSNLPGGNALTGTIEDVFTDETGTGVVVRPEGGGKAMREYLDTLNELGVSITPSDPLAEADAIDAALAAQASAPMEVSSPLPSAGAETPSPRPSGRTPSKAAGGGVNSAIVEGLKKRGFSEGQALGIAAGIHAESASNPNAKNPTSGAMGLGQWLGPRKDAIRKRFGDNPTLDQQLDFLADELRGGDAGGKYVLAQNDPAKVLDAYVRKFMRPAAGAETDGDIARGMAALGQAPTDTGPLVPESTTQFADRPQREMPSVEVTAAAPDLPSVQQQESDEQFDYKVRGVSTGFLNDAFGGKQGREFAVQSNDPAFREAIKEAGISLVNFSREGYHFKEADRASVEKVIAERRANPGAWQEIRARVQASEQNTAGPQDGEIAPTVEAPKVGGSLATAADSAASAGGAVTPARAPIPARKDGKRDVAVTATGSEIPVDYAVVEMGDLVASNTPDGGVNPAYPADRQPRDRTRAASQTQIAEIASRLNPRLLGRSPKASDGAPIISPDGIVESGNGRTLALQRVYGENGENAQAYRQFIESEGFDTSGMKQPVLVRIRDGNMSTEQVQEFVRAANVRDTAGMSGTETAGSDAAAMPAQMVDLYRGGDIEAAGNRDFVKTFVNALVPTNERASMILADGSIAKGLVARMEAALLVRAFGQRPFIEKMVDATDSNIRAIGKALVEMAGKFAKLREAAQDERVDPVMDITGNIAEAVEIIDRARREGKPIGDYVNQRDIFSGATVDPMTEAALRTFFFARPDFTKPLGQQRIVEAMDFYVEEAMKAAPGGGLFGESTKATPDGILNLANERRNRSEPQDGDLFAAPREPSNGVDGARDAQPGGNDQRPAGEGVQARPGSESGSSRQEVAPSRVRIEDAPSGKSIAIFDASNADLAKIAAAVPKAKPSNRSDGAVLYSKKYEAQIREALTGATETVIPNAEQAPAILNRVITPANRDGTGQYTAGNYDVMLSLTPNGDAKIQIIDTRQRYKGQTKLTSEQRKTVNYADVKPDLTPAAKAEIDAFLAQMKGADESIGTNAKGLPLYEDENGVRSYVERGIRITEPVELRPVRGAGMQMSVDPSARRGEFLTEEERGASALTIRNLRTGEEQSMPLPPENDPLSPRERAQLDSLKRRNARGDLDDADLIQMMDLDRKAKGDPTPAQRPAPVLKPTDQATIDLLTRMAEAEDRGSYVPIEIGSTRVKMMVAEGLIIENKGKSDAMWITSEKGRKLLDDAGVPHAQSPKPTPAPSANRLVTDERAAELRERLKAKLNPGRLNSGIDPEIIAIGTELAVYHIEKGARRFQAFAKAIADDLGMKVQDLRLYMRGWYNGARDMMEDAGESVAGMDTPDEVAKSMRTLEQWANEPAQEPAPAPSPAPEETATADPVTAVRDFFLNGGRFATIVEARKFLSEQTGEDIRAGTPEAKRADETIEAAVVQAARTIAARNESNPIAAYRELVDLYQRQPNLAVRSSTSVEQQAYSTPVPLAYLASRRAGIDQNTTVYEPTAGNGALLIDARATYVTANELNPDRNAQLRAIYRGAKITQQDASTFTPPGAQRDVVIANPPFGVVKDTDGEARTFNMGDGYVTREIDHAISLMALDSMKNDGKAVLIVGSINKQISTERGRADAYNAKAKREFYYRLYNEYNVTDHFTVAGELYAKQGAGWPVDVIVIEGRGKSALPLPAVKPPRQFDSWSALETEVERRPSVQPATGTAPGNLAQQGAEPARGDGRDSASGRGGRTDRLGQPTAAQQPGDVRAGSPDAEPNGGRLDNASPRSDARPAADNRTRADRRPPQVKREAVAGENARQVTYQPASGAKSLDTLVPVNMQTAISNALGTLQDRVGAVDSYVADRLGFDEKDIATYFSAEQVDALALAIDNMERGAGFIIGDQTGIGKGRVVAGVIRYALRSGRMPIFVTEKPNLYADMYRDMNDVGIPKMLGRPVDILMTNAAEKVPLNEDGSDELKTGPAAKHNAVLERVADGDREGVDVLFTTYSQMQSMKGEWTPRQRAIQRLAPGSIIIFDESHNAGGQGKGNQQRKPKKQKEAEEAGMSAPNRAEFARQIAKLAHGVFFSSATYAKRPDVMDLYASTDMRHAVSDIEKLGDAISKGGIPMQQVVASMLTEAGQYVRRERSFEGVEYRTPPVQVDRASYSQFTGVLRAIQDFQEQHIADAVEAIADDIRAEAQAVSFDGSVGSAGATSTNFTSVMHNVVEQMLLAMKAAPAAARAVELLQEGKKPVITVANTMGSFIKEYADENNIGPNQPMPIDFRSLLIRYLDRTREINIKRPFSKDKAEKRYITDAELGGAGAQAYQRVRAQIEAMDLAAVPVSPVDYIRNEIIKAGYRVGEITGRTATLDYSTKTPRYRIRPGKETSILGRREAITGFNSGTIDAMILNQAGSTGLSLHASATFKDKRTRVMIIAQAERNIDTHMQMLGRIHRTGQVVLPEYDQLVAAVPAEMRPAAVLAKKMASLNANTTGARDSAMTGEDVPDFMNEYGDEIAARMMEEDEVLHKRLGTPLSESDGEKDGYKREDAARKVTGRLMLLPLEEQEAFYDNFLTEYRDYLAQKEAAGEATLEAKTLDLDAKVLASQQVVEPTQPNTPFGEAVYQEVLDVKRLGKPLQPDQIMQDLEQALGPDGFPSSDAQSNMAAIDTAGSQWMDEFRSGPLAAFDAYRRETLDGMDDAKVAANAERLQANLQAFNALASTIHPGATVQLVSPEGDQLRGVVLSVEKKGNPKNPLALGAYRATFAFIEATGRTTIPFSQLRTDRMPESAAARTVYPIRNIDGVPVMQAFSEMQVEAREKRVFLTGNILAAYEHTGNKGQIVNFVDSEGAVRPGLMMRRGWDYQKEMAKRPVPFRTPEQVMAWLEEGETALADNVKVERVGSRLIVTAAAAKSVGGKFFLDKGVLSAVGGDFYKKSTGMVAETTMDKARAVITALQSAGATFTAKTNLDRAREIVAGGGKRQSIPESSPAASPTTDVREALREQLANLRLADKVKVRLVDTLGGAAGEYRAQIVTIAQDTPQGEVFTLNHEAIHVLRDLGLFNTSEWAILSAKARRETGLMRSIRQRYEAGFRQRGMTGAAMEEALIEEAVADMFARHQDGQYKAEGTTDRLFKMLRQFFEAVRNAFAGRGLRTAEGVMQDVAAGEVGGRNSQAALDGSARQSRPYENAPDNLMGFSSDGSRQKAFGQNRYQIEQDVAVTIGGGTFIDTIEGLNGPHAMERARRNWPNAENIEAVGEPRRAIKFSIPERDDLVALGGTEPTWKGKAADAFDRWRTAMQDRYLPLLKVQRQIEEQTGKPLPVSRNPYMGEELMTGRIGARLERLAEEHVQPLFDAMHAEKVTTEELESFLYARHAPERNARIAEINPEFTEGEGSGMTDLEAAAIMSRVRKAGKMEAMERLAKRVDQIRDDALDYRVQTGLISKEEADEWRSTYQFYVPLRGFKETGTDAIPERMNRSGGGINVRGRESKQAFGRRSQADSPLAYLILQAEEAIIRGETNIVAARFYNLAKANPDKEFWSINKPTVRQRMNEESGLVESYTTYNLLAEDKDWTVSAKINGREVRVTMNKQNVDARRLADAMRNLTQHQLDWVTLHMGKVNRFLSAVNTSYNPEFIITNAFRDLQTATFNLSGEGVKGIVRGTLKDYRKALAASAKGAFGKHSGEWGKWYDEFVMNGGRVYFNKVENVEEIKKRIASAAEMAKAKAGEGGPRLQAKRLFLAGRDMIENLNNGVENAVRLSVYKNAREAGLTPAQAASMAKNVTVNFNRRGTAGPAMNAAYLFFNASVQGSARILMALRSPRVRKMVAGVMIAAAAAEILNAMMSADDDDGESIYDKIPAFEKSRNIILMMPDGKSYIKIPMPYGYNAFWEAGRSAAEIARRGGDRWLETMGQFAGTVADAFNPIGGSDSLLNILSPTITDPIVDLTLNKDFTGKPIMPNQSPYGPEEPDNQRYFNSVGPHWKTITEFLNASTGGDEVQPGAIDVSPETLEYLSGTVIGSAGAFLDRSLGLIGKSMDESEDITADDIPVARKVVGGKPSWVDKSAFYDRLHAVETAMDRTEKYLEAGNQEAAYEYAMDNKAALMLEGAAKQARKDMREVRKARNELEMAKDRDQIDDATYRDKKAIVRRAEELVTTDFNSQWVAVMKARRDESGGD